MEPLIFVE